jgi:hypothetical protein
VREYRQSFGVYRESSLWHVGNLGKGVFCAGEAVIWRGLGICSIGVANKGAVAPSMDCVEKQGDHQAPRLVEVSSPGNAQRC